MLSAAKHLYAARDRPFASLRVTWDDGSKRGILILGIANAGKTRLAFEALTQTLPDWKVLLWNATYDTPSKVPVPTVSRGSGLVVFIDDLQEYAPAEGSDADGLGSL